MLCAILAWPALAETRLPALNRVTGVAADDVLNVRAGPGVAHGIVGSLSPDTVVEVTATGGQGGRWGRINLGEGPGWVALRFLSALPGGTKAPPASCFGTEPFWTLDLADHAFRTPEGTMPTDPPVDVPSMNRPDRSGVIVATSQGSLRGIVRRETCSDGMSDALYGLSIDLFTADDGAILSGCCTLAR